MFLFFVCFILKNFKKFFTFLFICSRTSFFISPVSPEKTAKYPCDREFITSISCNETVLTFSMRFKISPDGHETNFTCGPSAS